MALPCIVSNMGGLPEAVENGVTGYICKAGDAGDLADKLDAVYGLSEAKYADMCEAAVIKAKKDYGADQYLQKITGLYAGLIKEKGGSV